jgi:integrase
MARRPLEEDYEKRCKSMMQQFLVPYFGKMRMDRITEEEIDFWLVNFIDREKRKNTRNVTQKDAAALVPKKLKASYGNIVFGVLRLMLKQAVKRHIIPYSPADNVEKLQAEKKQIEILTLAECKELFAPKPKALPAVEVKAIPAGVPARFDRKGFALETAKMANLVAACTGMRIGEVLGLKGEYVFADYIRVNGQYKTSGYGPTKTRTKRNIPLSPAIMDGLRKLVAINGNGYLFSVNGGAKPITRYYFNKYLTSGLKDIGIEGEEKKRRNLTPHAWRHFLNTALRSKGITDAKVQSITGHQTQEMTDHYTHFNNAEFADVREVQNTLFLSDGQTVKAADEGGNEKISKVSPRALMRMRRRNHPAGGMRKAR